MVVGEVEATPTCNDLSVEGLNWVGRRAESDSGVCQACVKNVEALGQDCALLGVEGVFDVGEVNAVYSEVLVEIGCVGHIVGQDLVGLEVKVVFALTALLEEPFFDRVGHGVHVAWLHAPFDDCFAPTFGLNPQHDVSQLLYLAELHRVPVHETVIVLE